jgi:hypothetical protein
VTSASRERGTGLVASIAGVTVFLAFLTVGVQVLVDLYQTSVVTAVGYDVARSVATRPDQPLEPASARVRELLGGVGDEAELTWDVDDAAGVVRLHLVVPTRRFLLPIVAGPLGIDEVDRTITVRMERTQG